MEYKKYTDEEFEKFCEDNGIDEGVGEKLGTFIKNEEINLDFDDSKCCQGRAIITWSTRPSRIIVSSVSKSPIRFCAGTLPSMSDG